jgi:hypothetical protein
MIIKKMIRLHTSGKSYSLATRFGESLTTMHEMFAYFMYYHNRFLDSNFEKFDDFTNAYNLDNRYGVVEYTDNDDQETRIYKYNEYFVEIDTRYAEIAALFSSYSDEKLLIIHNNAELKNMSPILYLDTYHEPTCLIRIKDSGIFYQLKVSNDTILSVIAERLAYYMHKSLLTRHDKQHRFENMTFPPNNFDIKYKVDDAWVVYDYTEHLDEINTIYQRFTEILADSLEELSLIEKFTEDHHYNDPLALDKICHNCGNNTPHYNGACNRHCSDLIYSSRFVCRYGKDCPLCPFIVRS